MTDRKYYTDRMENQINQLGARIDDLLSAVEVRARKEYDILPERLDKARSKLNELKDESGETWQEIKPGLERAWTELRGSFEQATSRFRSR